MERTFPTANKLNSVLLIFVSILLLSFHFYFIYFVNSTYIQAFVGTAGVGVVYAIGGIFNIILFLMAPKILRRYGLLNMTLGLAVVEFISLLFIAFPISAASVIGAFFFHTASATLLVYCMDMFLEQYGPKDEIGTMRGIFLTMWNIPPIVTPFIAGIIISTNDMRLHAGRVLAELHEIGYWKIYLISAAFLIPFMIILRVNFRTKTDPVYPDMNILDTIGHFLKHRNIYDVFVDRILLNFFFAIFALYLPIYLHDFIGMAWGNIGILISLTCVPYVLMQSWIGRMQDKRSGEKSLLIAGFLIMSIGTMLLPFLITKNIVPWAIILVTIEIGACVVEISSESYFFRHVSPTNSGFISLFRMTRTLPYILIPPFVAGVMAVLPFSYLFLVLGLIMLLGIRYAFLIRN
jgi:MFS family permease